MWQQERRQRLRSMLARTGNVSVDEATIELGVSRETIRRDLLEMEAEGALRRVRGGAVAPDSTREPPYAERATVRMREKRQIARAAAALVQPGQMVFLDAGSTTTILAGQLAQLHGIMVITNSIEVANCLASAESQRHRGNEVVLLGGAFGLQPPATFGMATLREISRYRADIALLSPFGLDAAAGATSYDPNEAEIARTMFHHARQRVLLADHSKLGQVSRASYWPTAEADLIIVDDRAQGTSAFEAIHSENSNLLLAGQNQSNRWQNILASESR